MAKLNSFYTRPSLIIFSETEPVNVSGSTDWNLGLNYIYLSDDNREPMQVSYERKEYKQRMANGKMRSFYVTDKRSFSTGWSDFPSRRVAQSGAPLGRTGTITSDKFAAGIDLVNWFNTHNKDFWMLLVYDGAISNTTLDSWTGTTVNSSAINQSAGWAEKIHVFYDQFNFTIKKRGQYNDLWDVTLSLVEA